MIFRGSWTPLNLITRNAGGALVIGTVEPRCPCDASAPAISQFCGCIVFKYHNFSIQTRWVRPNIFACCPSQSPRAASPRYSLLPRPPCFPSFLQPFVSSFCFLRRWHQIYLPLTSTSFDPSRNSASSRSLLTATRTSLETATRHANTSAIILPWVETALPSFSAPQCVCSPLFTA